jgi:Glycosyl transferase family 2
MRLSIVVINYNYERYLAEAIECALAVRWRDKEVIVVDDGSTDGSVAVLERFAGRVAATIVKANGGQNSAANAGFERSTGDVVMFLDSDDTLFRDVAKHVMPAFDETVSKVQFGLYKIDGDGLRIAPAWPVFGPQHTPEWVRRMVAQTGYYATPPTSGIAWSRRFLSEVFPLPVRRPGKVGRWGLWFDDYLSMLAPFFGDVVSLPTALGNYRLHGTNDTGGRAFSPELVAAVCVEETQRAFAVNTVLAPRLERQPVDIELLARHMKHRLIYRCLLGEQYPYSESLGELYASFCRAVLRDHAGFRSKCMRLAWGAGMALAPRAYALWFARIQQDPKARPELLEQLWRFRVESWV